MSEAGTRLEPEMARAFTAEDFEARMERAARSAQEAGLSGVLVTPGPDLLYLTGYAPTAITERLDDARRRHRTAQPAMIVPMLERPDAEAAPGSSNVELSDWADGRDPYESRGAAPRSQGPLRDLGRGLGHARARAAGPSPRDHLRLDDHRPADAAGRQGRRTSSSDSTAAGEAADAALYDILEARFSGRTEAEVAADLADALKAHGHSEVEFTLVGSGPNGANPHHEFGERVIEEGDMVVLDFGGTVDGYSSDTTRTVHVGEPTRRGAEGARDRPARPAGRRSRPCGPGVACQEIDRAARTVIADAGYGERFIHRTGHGIGLTAHEPPYLVEGEELPLEPGMCFSIEPGIYLPDEFGVRIEDIVAVTEDGGRRLNTTPRELTIVA